MSPRFVPHDDLDKAKSIAAYSAPHADHFIKIEGGWLAFRDERQYREWLKEREVSERKGKPYSPTRWF